jgi:predicted metal-dependent hydrolase
MKFGALAKTSPKPAPHREVGSLALGGRAIPLLMRKSRRARYLSLRLDPVEDAVELVLPWGVSLREGLRFAATKTAWLSANLEARPPRILFIDGVRIPYLGSDHRIVHDPAARAGVRREAGCILVSGAPEFLPRRVRDWLKREAAQILAERARVTAARIGRRAPRVRVRDPKSRWGSCAPDGGLSFSWRLVLAPESVLDYVVAHEVAHLVHANHGKRFWRLVAELATEGEAARAWLRANGAALLRYG